MFAGHFGLAAAVKAGRPEVPLWALMLSTQLLDVIFVPLFVSGIETIEPVDGGGYGGGIIHADYTHSLAGALLITLVAGYLAKRAWGKHSGWVIAGTVFSHWLLDLIVHRSDLPILPDNLGDLPLLGFGLWSSPGISAALEAILIAGGALLYWRSALSRAKSAAVSANSRGPWLRATVAGAFMSVLLIASLLVDAG